MSSTPASEPRLSFLQNSETYQRLKETYEDSENPFISSIRSMQHTVGSWFEENETAKVVRKMRELDPEWNMEGWQRELREYIVPEIVDAYLGADREALKLWCGEAVSSCFGLPFLTTDIQRVVGYYGSIHQARLNLRLQGP